MFETAYYNTLIENWIGYECDEYMKKHAALNKQYKNVSFDSPPHDIFLSFTDSFMILIRINHESSWKDKEFKYFRDVVFNHRFLYKRSTDQQIDTGTTMFSLGSHLSKKEIQRRIIDYVMGNYDKQYTDLFEKKVPFECSSSFIKDNLSKKKLSTCVSSLIDRWIPSICHKVIEDAKHDIVKYNIPFDYLSELLYQCIKYELSEKIEIFKKHGTTIIEMESKIVILKIHQKSFYIKMNFDGLTDSWIEGEHRISRQYITFNERDKQDNIYQKTRYRFYLNIVDESDPACDPDNTKAHENSVYDNRTYKYDNLESVIDSASHIDYCKDIISKFISILDDTDKAKLSRGEFITESQHLFKTDYVTNLMTLHSARVALGKKDHDINELMIDLAGIQISV